ncbi:undecaprenyl-diphosphatase [Friedmanniella luteola]|uniref:Undecaprenyl-diphosphatase n=1 Tax=Friedmanniella luteola TaxID=546871 RepID=A0A1H1WH24_9ACTN|nr:phosphatase PAP2 family protein [Friedmanniella luteola]SDS95576.1 undecaprenyl-diphosphatase [Friedmanniella luteola]
MTARRPSAGPVLTPTRPATAPARPAEGPSVRPPGWWLAAAAAALLGFVLVLALVVAAGGVDRFDTDVLDRALALRTPALTAAARSVTTLGSAPLVVTVAVLVAAVLWRRTRDPLASVVLLVAVLVTGAGVYLTKIAVGRARPSGTTLLGGPSWDGAFPSGHTTDGTVVYVLSALLLGATVRPAARRALLAVAVVLAVAVGLSRVYLGYHWGTDVVAGWLLAAAVVWTAGFVARSLAAGAGAPARPARALDGSGRRRRGRGWWTR